MPVDPTLFGAFIVVAIMAILLPGPDTMLVIRNTLNAGQRLGMATMAGVQIGLLVHMTAAILGLSALIVSVPVAFDAVAIAGAAYLAYLGLSTVIAGRRGDVPLSAGGAIPRNALRACRDAILTNVLNPKVMMLFIALMPGFIDLERASVPVQFIILAATVIVLNILWQSSLVWLAATARRWLEQPRVQRNIALATGVIFMAFAVLLMLDHLVRRSHG